MWRFSMVALCALSACSFDASGVTPGGGGSDGALAPDSAIPIVDGGPVIDGHVTLDAAPDAAPPTSCSGQPDGTRLCDGNFVSQCGSGNIVHERPCPNASFCFNGECVVSPFQRSCAGNECQGTDLCTAFVTHPLFTTMVELHCATPDAAAGTGVTMMQCISGTECRSGICADGGFCFTPCQAGDECDRSTNAECRSIPLHVDGVIAALKGCGPGL
jgi:hypothetical protein